MGKQIWERSPKKNGVFFGSPPNYNDQIIITIRYYTGDLVNVTCYSRGSSPPANLHWKVNNERVFDEVADMEQYR